VKFHYYPDTDSLYIEFSDRPGVDSQEVAPGVVIDFDENGHPVGLDIDRASSFVNLSTLEAESLPIKSFALES
jgi:uncharacterized protein YuzE